MNDMPEILRGVIALEYAETLTKLHSACRDPTETCGSACTEPPFDSECAPGTCGIPAEKEYKTRAFYPAVQGWSEPPAARV